MDDQTFFKLIHQDPRVPLCYLSEDVKRRLAEILDLPSNDGTYRHVAKLLGYNVDQQRWIEQLKFNLRSPTLNLFAVIEQDKPSYTVQELVSALYQLKQMRAIAVIKARWLDIQRLNGTLGAQAMRNTQPMKAMYHRQPVQHTEAADEEFVARGCAPRRPPTMPAQPAPFDPTHLLIRNHSSAPTPSTASPFSQAVFQHHNDYPQGVPKSTHGATSFHHPHLPHNHSPHQPHYPTPPPTAPRRSPSPKDMDVDEDVKPKIEEPTSPHPTEQQLLHQLYKQEPEKSTPQTPRYPPDGAQYNTQTAVGNLSVKNHEYPGAKVKAQGPYSMDLNLQGPNTMMHDLRMKCQGHAGQGHERSHEYPYASQSSAQPFNFNPSLGAEQHAPYDLSATRVTQGSRSQPPQPPPMTRPIQVKEEPMDYYDHYQQQQQQQQQEGPIDYTQKSKAVNLAHTGHFPTPTPTPIPTPQHHNGQTSLSSNQSSSEDDNKAFQRQSAVRKSYPPLKSPEPRDRDSDTPNKTHLSAKEPMEHTGFSKGQRYDVRVLITYAYDSKKHVQDVIRLAKCLQNNGFAVTMDQNELKLTQQQYLEKYERADAVLVCISPQYYSRTVQGREAESDEDAKLHTTEVYRRMQQEFSHGPPSGRRKKLLCPLLFPTASPSHLPQWMCNLQSYTWPQDWRNLMFYISRPEQLVERARSQAAAATTVNATAATANTNAGQNYDV